MLYEITVQSIRGGDDEFYESRIVEAPSHRAGLIKAELATFATNWAQQLLAQRQVSRALIGVAEYRPLRVGYRLGSNSSWPMSNLIAEWRTERIIPSPT